MNGGAEFAGAQTYFEPLDTVLVSSLEPRAGTKVRRCRLPLLKPHRKRLELSA